MAAAGMAAAPAPASAGGGTTFSSVRVPGGAFQGATGSGSGKRSAGEAGRTGAAGAAPSRRGGASQARTLKSPDAGKGPAPLPPPRRMASCTQDRRAESSGASEGTKSSRAAWLSRKPPTILSQRGLRSTAPGSGV
jgi:hypothetical protein